MSISLKISVQIVALINKGKSRHSVALLYNLAHNIVNHIYECWHVSVWMLKKN